MTTHYHAGWNMVGYLPEMDSSYPYESFADAKASMIDDLLRFADSAESWADEHDCDDIPCPTYGDNCPWNQAQDLSNNAEDLNLDNGPAWDAYVGYMHYWIVDCEADWCGKSYEESSGKDEELSA